MPVANRLFSLIVAATISVAPSLLTLGSDAEVKRAKEKHPLLFVMIHSPHDPGCTMALPMFRKAHNNFEGRANVTFAVADIEYVPKLAASSRVSVGTLPGYALLLAGLAKPVRYTGGWSENSISTWVKQQAALQMQVIKGNIDDLLGFARDAQPNVLVVGFMTAAQRNKRLLEASARSVQALGVQIALGDDALAAELGAEVPSVVVCRLGAERWPLLRGQSLGHRDVENFLRLRALPSVTPVGEVERTFAMQVRSHPAQMHVMLVHRSGKQGPHEASERALREMRDAAPAFEGRALFLSYDFYDNNPEMFTVHGVLMNELPALLVIHGRGGFGERSWRLPGHGGRFLITSDSIRSIVSRALSEVGDGGENAIADGKNRLDEDLPAPPGTQEEPIDARTRKAAVGTHGEVANEDNDDADDDDDELQDEEDDAFS